MSNYQTILKVLGRDWVAMSFQLDGKQEDKTVTSNIERNLRWIKETAGQNTTVRMLSGLGLDNVKHVTNNFKQSKLKFFE